MIELIVAIFVLSIGLLGIASLNLISLRSNHSAYLESVANQQLLNMAERLRATDGQSVGAQAQLWNQYNQWLLPDGQGSVSKVGEQFVIVLSWHWRDNQVLSPECATMSQEGYACVSMSVMPSKIV